MPYFSDQANRSVQIASPPNKIISLVPSQTELLFDLGLDATIIGTTKFCIHPHHWFRTKQWIGGTKNPNLQLIQQLQPDLIIGNKEENRKEDIDTLAAQFPVWLSDINNLEDALQMIDSISLITATTANGQHIIGSIKAAFDQLRSSRLPEEDNSSKEKFRVCYLIWQDPFIVVANNTFINSMLQECGFINVFETGTRYPTTSVEEIRASKSDFIFLSTEPFPFKEKHRLKISALFPDSVAVLVDGELFSWYGSRLTKSAPYFQTLINRLQHAAGTK